MINVVRPAHKKAVLFDVNQTLVEQGCSFEQCFKSVWQDYTARWLVENAPTKEQVWEEYTRRWQLRRKGRLSARLLDEMEQECFQETVALLEIPLPQTMLRSMLMEARKLQANAKRPAPSTAAALQALSQQYKLAIISNSPRPEVVGLLERFGMLSYFKPELILTPTKPSEKKPSPFLFKAALKRLELTPKQVLMVGNSWKHDICGATKAGIDAVWYHPSREPSDRTDNKKVSQQKLGKRSVYFIEQFKQLQDLLL